MSWLTGRLLYEGMKRGGGETSNVAQGLKFARDSHDPFPSIPTLTDASMSTGRGSKAQRTSSSMKHDTIDHQEDEDEVTWSQASPLRPLSAPAPSGGKVSVRPERKLVPKPRCVLPAISLFSSLAPRRHPGFQSLTVGRLSLPPSPSTAEDSNPSRPTSIPTSTKSNQRCTKTATPTRLRRSWAW